MSPKQRFITRGVAEKIPPWLQTFMWPCIDELEIEADYLQVFDLSADGHMLRVSHSQEYAGEDIENISAHLGHASADITSRVYCHMYAEVKVRMAKTVSSALLDAK